MSQCPTGIADNEQPALCHYNVSGRDDRPEWVNVPSTVGAKRNAPVNHWKYYSTSQACQKVTDMATAKKSQFYVIPCCLADIVSQFSLKSDVWLTN